MTYSIHDVEELKHSCEEVLLKNMYTKLESGEVAESETETLEEQIRNQETVVYESAKKVVEKLTKDYEDGNFESEDHRKFIEDTVEEKIAFIEKYEENATENQVDIQDDTITSGGEYIKKAAETLKNLVYGPEPAYE